jgi:hypothetical protein
MRVAWIVLLLVTLPAVAKAGISDEVTQRINQDVRAVLQRTETPGATIAGEPRRSGDLSQGDWIARP